jgi:hypothetical protein
MSSGSLCTGVGLFSSLESLRSLPGWWVDDDRPVQQVTPLVDRHHPLRGVRRYPRNTGIPGIT